jgi:hypothetical protein
MHDLQQHAATSNLAHVRVGGAGAIVGGLAGRLAKHAGRAEVNAISQVREIAGSGPSGQ